MREQTSGLARRAGARLGALAGFTGLLTLLASPALAQEDAAESRSAVFEAAQGARLEEIPGGGLLVAAYGVVWLLVLAYVVSLGIRQARTARELERLRQDLEAARPGEGA